ncbi:MAG: hypothetical protein CMI74_04465 [Candidatus Pelagibacter sp.]|nr:hypothetical protein [Candidatus Pelagibacter sp.]
MKILLTGSEGFVGKNIRERLTQHEFVCVDRKIGYDVMTCTLPTDIDLVIHLAGNSGVRTSLDNPTEYWKNNVIASQRLFKFYSTYKNVRILYASSSTAKEPWKNPYAMSKYGMEMIAPENSLGMRFTTVYGPHGRQNMMIPLIIRKEVEWVNCDHHRDFIHVYDLVDAIKILLLKDLTGVIDIGTGNTVFVRKLVEDFGMKPEMKIGSEMERVDNKADADILYKYGWKPHHDLYEYIESERLKGLN